MRPATLWAVLFAILLLPGAARAQETRGNINGIVQDKGGVIPGAVVRITNTGTSQTQQLVTNDRGYFEAVLLNPGAYETGTAGRTTSSTISSRGGRSSPSWS